jgi:uncharacterized protein YcgI (DUF1989 family)
MSASERYHHRRPFDQATYDAVRAALQSASAQPQGSGLLPAEGLVLTLAPSDVVRLTLVEGPQVVHLHAWNLDDPDERIWTNETSSKENAFLSVDHRIWGTMARFRPLLTVVEDTVRAIDAAGLPVGRHHFVLGGGETPFAWRVGGGDPAIPSAWDRFRDLMAAAGADPATYRDHVSLFQKVAIDVPSQRFDVVPSDSRTGDLVSLFAEIPLRVALVPSAYREGGTLPANLDGATRGVSWEILAVDVPSPGWPYPGVPYPDLAPYLGPEGRRA